MITLPPIVFEFIIWLEQALSEFVIVPDAITLPTRYDSQGREAPVTVTNPYIVTKIWFDEHEGTPTLGVTYSEISVKNGRSFEIFKAVRGDTPFGVIEVFFRFLPELITKLKKQKRAFDPLFSNEIARITEMIDE